MCATWTRTSRPSPSSTVAVIDDDPAVRRAMSRMLRSAGLRVASFSTADELLQAYDDLRPSCLVVDVALPGMSGPDLLDRLRASHPSPSVIFVTGRLDTQQSLKRRGMGKVPCLQKPFEPALLIEAVSRALSAREPAPH